MIKTSGYRVSPTEVEEAAYATGLVRDAVALGVEDALLGQRVALVVAMADGERRRCRRSDRTCSSVTFRSTWCPRWSTCGTSCPRSPNGKFDRALLRQEIGSRERHPTIAAFDIVDGQLAVGGIPLERLAERVGSTPFFAYDRRLLTERVATLRAALPDRGRSQLRREGESDAGGRATPRRRWSTRFDVASAGELRTALDTPIRRRARQLRRARQERRASSARRSQRA